jgi:hypothetical protein
MQWQIYHNNENKLYNKIAISSSLLWIDGSMNMEKVLTAEINKNVIEIQGYTCDELILTCENGIQKYYFNDKIKVDAKMYENHKFGNWNEVISRTNALPLKIISDNEDYTSVTTVTEIVPMKVDDAIFQLPANVKIEKAPY